MDSVQVDELTGLYNHGYFQDRLQEEIERAARYEHPVALIMFDVDDFKQYNDAHGHRLGDLVLREVGNIVQQTIRDTDCACRYGGDEFCIICPETVKEEAKALADRLLTTAQEHRFRREDGSELDDDQQFKLTLSIGVSTYPDDCDSRVALIELADMGLYFSKRRGKNRVTVF
jgi:diguanylate cyclase (GGDEF)-like protein